MTGFRVQRWTNEEFLAGRAAWQALLARSQADALFMSWDWISAWWRHHAPVLRAELCVLAVHAPGGELCGIAPFYIHDAVHRGFARVHRLELLGNVWRSSSAVFSEYLDLIAPTGRHDAVCASVRDWLLASAEWDELLLCNLRADSLAAQLADGLAGSAYARAVDSMTGWSLSLPDSFDAFVTRLSSNTRRKVVHQREKLAGVAFEITPPAQRAAALERLDAWVARRFGSSAGDGSMARARFHADLVENWNDDVVRLSELHVAGACVSVMLNLRVGGTEYYLQSGFDAVRAHGVSPGLLHLGYAIEAACRDGIRRFDLLAGRGLHRDYKQDFAADSAPLHSLQIVRKPWLRALFRGFDRLRGRTSHKARIGA